MDKPPRATGSWKEFLFFLLKLILYLAGLAGFGLLVFWLRRSL